MGVGCVLHNLYTTPPFGKPLGVLILEQFSQHHYMYGKMQKTRETLQNWRNFRYYMRNVLSIMHVISSIMHAAQGVGRSEEYLTGLEVRDQ